MNRFQQFLWGFVGGVSMEIPALNQLLQTGHVRIPIKYKTALYWLLRLCLCVAGGLLCIAYSVSTPIEAWTIGASAPLLIAALNRGAARKTKQDSEIRAAHPKT